MIALEIIEDLFNKKSTSSYNLSMLLGMNRFSYLITDQQQQVVALVAHDFDQKVNSNIDVIESLKKLFVEDQYLKLPYSSYKLALVSPTSTLIPTKLFKDEHKADYLANIIRLGEEDVVFEDLLPTLDVVNVYNYTKEVTQLVKNSLPKTKIYHINSPVLMGFKQATAHRDGKKIYINVKDQLLTVVLFEDTDLVFCNAFSFKTSKDFIYYLLLVFEQFKLKTEVTPVFIAGSIIEESEVYHLLYRYIRHLSMIPSPNYYHFGKKFGDRQKHIYFDLFSLKLCE